jgi:hypothetical protein
MLSRLGHHGAELVFEHDTVVIVHWVLGAHKISGIIYIYLASQIDPVARAFLTVTAGLGVTMGFVRHPGYYGSVSTCTQNGYSVNGYRYGVGIPNPL